MVEEQSRKAGHTTWTHCKVDIKILTKRSLDKADVDAKSTHHKNSVQIFHDVEKLIIRKKLLQQNRLIMLIPVIIGIKVSFSLLGLLRR